MIKLAPEPLTARRPRPPPPPLRRHVRHRRATVQETWAATALRERPPPNVETDPLDSRDRRAPVADARGWDSANLFERPTRAGAAAGRCDSPSGRRKCGTRGARTASGSAVLLPNPRAE